MESMKEEVEEVLETLRPMLMQDGGNVELVDIEDGVVKVRLVGSCSSCSSSTMTLKMGIEKGLTHSPDEMNELKKIVLEKKFVNGEGSLSLIHI